jgi:glucose-1-phosphatase
VSIRALIFDLGGVLIRSEDQGRREFWEKRLGYRGVEIARVLWLSPVGRKALIGQAAPDEAWEEVGKHFDLNSDELNCLKKDFMAESIVDMDLLNFIRGLRPRYKTGVISDAFAGARERLLSVIPAESFDFLVFSAEEGMVKPAPAIFLYALNGLGVFPAEAIFVDDLPHNIAGARALGMKAIQFRDSEQVRSEILNLLDEKNTGGQSDG